MQSNRYNIFKCECGEKAVGCYSDGKTKDDGTYKMIYACQKHIQHALRLLKLYELKSYDLVTNEHGARYMKPKADIEPLDVYMQRESMPEQVQISFL